MPQLWHDDAEMSSKVNKMVADNFSQYLRLHISRGLTRYYAELQDTYVAPRFVSGGKIFNER
jgi:hypothetical protein